MVLCPLCDWDMAQALTQRWGQSGYEAVQDHWWSHNHGDCCCGGTQVSAEVHFPDTKYQSDIDLIIHFQCIIALEVLKYYFNNTFETEQAAVDLMSKS